MPRLPKITLIASDYPRLEQLARCAAQQGDPAGIFLMGEIDRAEILPEESKDLGSLVTIGSWVNYSIAWGVPPTTAQLVWPEQRRSTAARIPVLSSLGAALIGLRAGDEMPYFVAGSLNLVRIHSVSRSEPNVVTLFQSKAAGARSPFDDDPGPTAA